MAPNADKQRIVMLPSVSSVTVPLQIITDICGIETCPLLLRLFRDRGDKR